MTTKIEGPYAIGWGQSLHNFFPGVATERYAVKEQNRSGGRRAVNRRGQPGVAVSNRDVGNDALGFGLTLGRVLSPAPRPGRLSCVFFARILCGPLSRLPAMSLYGHQASFRCCVATMSLWERSGHRLQWGHATGFMGTRRRARHPRS